MTGSPPVSNEQLWAPWRIGYILGDKNSLRLQNTADLLPGAAPECFLCQCVPEEDDRKWLVVERGEHAITVLNRYPYNNGHLLVAPKHHCGRLQDLDDTVQMEMSRTIARLIGVLDKIIQPHGYNVGVNLGQAAGAGVPGHLHWHIVPRWNGDTSFMSSLAGIRTIPQSLEALWDLLAAELKSNPQSLIPNPS
jgi:ATP adenylyltransferase